MQLDPIALAETIKQAYAIDLVGRNPAAWKSLLQRYGSPSQSFEEKLSSLVRMRGPYTQVLNIPCWSQTTWQQFAQSVRGPLAPEGFDPEIVDTFVELGFDRLYQFQEEAMQQVLDDRHTLIVAGTGRGKTESWLLPLLQYILGYKRGSISGASPGPSTKALLVYPTKALAQDQLRRLITYLFRLNAKLDRAARITVGIFDGDTPYRSDTNKRNYLYQAFSHFRCPIYDAGLTKCQGCTRRLTITSDPVQNDRLILNLPLVECRDLVSLDFVHLTRDDIIEQRPDIVITNPDILNLYLLNINDVKRREMFVLEPHFIVLDEVHTYTELFGSFTGMILRRLREQRRALLRQRGHAGDDQLRIIAASATVANKEQLFSRLCGLPHEQISLAQERHAPLPEPPPHRPAPQLYQHQIDEDTIDEGLAAFMHGREPNDTFRELMNLFAIQRGDLTVVEGETEDVLGDLLFERLCGDPALTPGLNVVRAMYHALAEIPMTPAEFVSHLRQQYPELDDAGANLLIHNFSVLGALSGLVEGRVHLFAWPIDGMYSCVGCGKVYDEQRAQCEQCGGGFISKLVLCSICGQEAIESWMCPECLRLYPLSASVDGEMVYYQSFTCSCGGQARDGVRVIWRPFYHCTNCGGHTQIATLPNCGLCESRLVEQGAQLICSNSGCGRVYSSALEDAGCPSCQGALELAGDQESRCPECGAVGLAGAESRCACGGRLRVTLRLPWICRRCGSPTWGEAPARCTCGETNFALAGLFDLSVGERCQDCDKIFLDGHGCTRPGHQASVAEVDFQEYKIVDKDWRVSRPADWRQAVPCYHRGARYLKGSRYEALMRSPANVAVTSAQYGLRSLIGQTEDAQLAERLQVTKMMAFSDSYADMEELGRDFDEPEMDTFIDQLALEMLSDGDRTLKHITDAIYERIRTYNQSSREGQGRSSQPYDWVKHYEGKSAIYDLAESRFLAGFYQFRWRTRPGLTAEGLANIRLDQLPSNRQDHVLLAALLRRNRARADVLREDLRDELPHFDEVCDRLTDQGYVLHDRQRDTVALNPERIICSLVGPDVPISWDPRRDRFHTRLEEQLLGPLAAAEIFTLSPKDRTDISSDTFSRVAYRMLYSRPVILRSAVYKGDVPKEERRKIEDEFKHSGDLHFLSTGPAMEVGIDIGSLDLLLLLGTPPNINAYLQRVGRAGRRSKRSLVMSVSKRNPIDYYYYRRPLDLIQSTAQPVPLNDHNEEVLRVSLTWALLDFIAAHYWIQWRLLETPEGKSYSDGEPFLPSNEPHPQGIAQLTRVIFNARASEIDFGGVLGVLVDLIQRCDDKARAYLNGVLNYGMCRQCGSISLSSAVGACQQAGCSGRVEIAAERYAVLIDEAIRDFESHMVSFLRELRGDMRGQRRTIEDRRRVMEDELEDIPHRESQRRREFNAQIDRLTAQIQAIEGVISSLGELTFREAQSRSTESRYAYQIRSVSATVDLVLHRGEGRTQLLDPRSMEMAIKEYHPYAISLRKRERYVTCEVDVDRWRTKDLHERLSETHIPYDKVYACDACGRIYEQPDSSNCPRCGRLCLRVLTVSLGRAHIYRENHVLGPDPHDPESSLHPSDVYRLSRTDNIVDSTFALTDSRVCNYEPLQKLAIIQNHETVGSLEFGNLDLVTFSTGMMVSYQSGLHDPRPQLFVVCDDPNCRHGITARGDLRFCAIDAEHDRSRMAVLRPAYLLRTQGVRIQLHSGGHQVLHSVAHGLRMALEKIGGVLVRSIGELVLDDCVYLYDSTPGGSGVTVLLTRQNDGKYGNFHTAMGIIQTMLECNCLDGCPQCLYQYGCATRNSPRTLSRNGLKLWLSSSLDLTDMGDP